MPEGRIKGQKVAAGVSSRGRSSVLSFFKPPTNKEPFAKPEKAGNSNKLPYLE